MLIVLLALSVLFAFISDRLYKYWSFDTEKTDSRGMVYLTVLNCMGILFFCSIFNLSFSLKDVLQVKSLPIYLLSLTISTILAAMVRFKRKTYFSSDDTPVRNFDIRYLLRIICLIVSAALLLEIFVFNYRHFDLAFHKEPTVDLTKSYKVGDGFKANKDGSLTALKNGKKTIEFLDLNTVIQNLYLDCVVEGAASTKISFEMTDQKNIHYRKLSESARVIKNVDGSKYLKFYTVGKSGKMRLTFDVSEKSVLKIQNVSTNVSRPVYFSAIRVFAVFVCLFVLWAIRPSSHFYQYVFNLKSGWQKRILLSCILLQLFLLFSLVSKPQIAHKPSSWSLQYHELVDSFLEGKLYLNAKPSEGLTKLENPYDKSQRDAEKVKYRWDTAYYEGKYFVYFGVTPVLLLMLPYKVLTGSHVPLYMCTYIFCAVAVLAVVGLISRIVKKYFPKTPFLVYLLLTFAFINSTGMLFLIARPSIYEIPIAGALAFALVGLYFWISSVDDENRVNSFRLFMGSLSIALVSGCRPLLLLTGLFAVPVFMQLYNPGDKISEFLRNNSRKVAIFSLPFIIVGIGMMYYNYARFGDVTQFGLVYNLSRGNGAGLILGKLPNRIWMFLLKGVTINPKFPFVIKSSYASSLLAITYVEGMYGGVFSDVICLLALPVYALRRKLREKKLLLFAALTVVLPMIVAGFTFLRVNFNYRYIVDFKWPVILLGSIVYLLLFEIGQKNPYHKKALLLCLAFCFCFSFSYNFFVYFAEASIPAGVYYPIERLFEFWR